MILLPAHSHLLRVQVTHKQHLPVLKTRVADRLNFLFGGIDDFLHRLVAGELIELEFSAVENALREVLCDLECIGRVGIAENEVVNVLKS